MPNQFASDLEEYKLKNLLINRTQFCGWFCYVENTLKVWDQKSKFWSPKLTTYQ